MTNNGHIEIYGAPKFDAGRKPFGLNTLTVNDDKPDEVTSAAAGSRPMSGSCAIDGVTESCQ